MTCEETEILLHALADGELDAGHTREVEAHIAGCPGCTGRLREIRALHQELAGRDLGFAAPASLRAKIENALPRSALAPVTSQAAARPSRRSLLQGFALGSALSGAVAASVVLMVVHTGDERRILGEVVSAHLRSLQAEHLTDVVSSDQHTVKPWFNGRIDFAPPVPDLTAKSFTLLGGRLDFIDGKAVASLVYRRRAHIINLFVAPAGRFDALGRVEKIQGFNMRRWTTGGLGFIALSDINAEELEEFGETFEGAARAEG